MLILTSLLLSFLSAYFISKANLGLSAKNIAELASAKYGYNSAIIRSLAEQNADNGAGILLLIIAIILQGVSAFVPMPIELTKINFSNIMSSVGISVFTFLLFRWLSRRRAGKLTEQAMAIKKLQTQNK